MGHAVRVPRRRRSRLALAAVSLVALGGAAGGSALTTSATRVPVGPERFVLVELTRGAAASDATVLRRAGATLVSSELRLFRIATAPAARVLPALRARHALRLTEPDSVAGSLAVRDFTDPLVGQQWWRTNLGLTTLTPPGPGKPATIIDSGVNFGHVEFAGRANLLALDVQEPAPIGGVHGTAVASLLGAPANGVGIVGIYPDADLASWDAARGTGTQLATSEIAAGILAAADRGPGVINLSLGSNTPSNVVRQALATAVRKGSLVVAAAGNDGERGSPLTYPASFPHVLTVGATGPDSRVASFSSRSRYVDLAAPGVDMTVADAQSNGWTVGDGTSFASPLVAGAAAWVWTVRPELDATQLFELLRRSATDVDAVGRDTGAGFGLLNVAGALTYAPVPTRDPLEPNDDVNYVKPGALFDTGLQPLTTSSKRRNTVNARVDSVEDPYDVYRVWLPSGGTTTITLTSDRGLTAQLLAEKTASVSRAAANLLATLRTAGPAATVTYRNPGKGTFAYLSVSPATGVPDATYRLQLSSR
jgi:hypothetical protein